MRMDRAFLLKVRALFLLVSNGEMRQLFPVEAKNTSWGAGATTALIALPILYVLSIWPVVYTLGDNRVDPRLNAVVNAFYKPLELLYNHTPLRMPLDGYIEWWAELQRGK